MKFGPRQGWLLAFWLGGTVCWSQLLAQESPPAPAVVAVKPEASQPAGVAADVEKTKLSTSGPADSPPNWCESSEAAPPVEWPT